MSRRDVKPPGGECHDVFGTNCDSSIVFPSTNSQAEQQPHHRITKPPGGETSDIFTTTPTSTPPSTPRKVKNYMASTIFTPDAQSAEQGQHKIRHRPDDGSFHRLFGASDSPQSSPHHQANGHGDNTDGQVTPRGKNHQKSNVLFAEGKSNGHTNGTNGHGANGHGTNGHGANGHGTNGHGANGHGTNGNDTGKIQNGGDSGSSSGSATPVGNGHANGHTNGHGNGHVNGHKTNGHANGSNGSNGSHEGSPNGGTPGKRIPPGGFSSKLW